MLQIQHIKKEYQTGSLVQKALDDVSLNLRDNEFVAILGPSGSGKTTLLNIIGGLDRYDSGDLIINGISTKKYKDRDWDSYRNHTIGFVFQSYNLIPHQTVLANVELALTISGVGKEERRKRAVDALEKVGLGQQLHKKPNQMSGGRCRESQLQEHWSMTRRSCLQMSRQEHWTVTPVCRSWIFLERWRKTVWSLWSHITRNLQSSMRPESLI